MGVHRPSHAHALVEYFHALARRLRRVRVCCGDWSRVMGPSVTFRHGVTAVFLDPPYNQDERDGELYASETRVSADVRKWAIENGDNPLLRIALCGYESEHKMPDTWTKIKWKARGGYGSQGAGRGRENATRECLWFSPHCLDLDALPMFAAMRDL
jgi:DNA adenine methylase